MKGTVFGVIKSVPSCIASVPVPPNVAVCSSEGNKNTGIPKLY